MKNECKIGFTGDIMCYPEMTDDCKENYHKYFDLIREDLKNNDYLVGNLETPIAGIEMGYTDEKWCFNSPESF